MRWLRTGLRYMAHPAMLLSMTVLAAALVRYGQLIPLTLVVVAAFWLYAWPQRKRLRKVLSPAGL